MKPEVLIVVMIMCGFGMMHNNYKKLAFPVFLLALFIYAGWIPALSKYFIVSEVSQPVEVQSQSQPQTHHDWGEPVPNYKLPKTPKRSDYINLILAKIKAEKSTLDPDFVIAIADSEGAWNPKAKSHANAKGLMQLIPTTAKRFGVTDRTDPVQNIAGGVRYLKWLHERFNGDYRLIAAGYNAGEGAVKKYGGIPPYNETQIYVSRVIGRMAGFKSARGDFSMRTPCKSKDCLHLKAKEAIAGGDSHQGLYALATQIQNKVPGFIYYSAFNDTYHQTRYCAKNPKSSVQHCYGRALDFTTVFTVAPNEVLKAVKPLLPIGVTIKHVTRCNGCTGHHFHVEARAGDNLDIYLKYALAHNLWEEVAL